MGRMNPGMKMMMLNSIGRSENHPRSEYGGSPDRRMIGYDRDFQTENRRRRDSRGRFMEGEGWQGNGSRYEHEDEMRMGGYGTGYNGSYNGGYDNGGHRMETESRRRRDSRGRYMMGGMDDDDEYDRRRMMDDPPHMRGGSRYGFGDVYAEVYAPNAMNRPMGGMGMMGGNMEQPVDEQTARMWVQKMDGGEHFKMEQADQLRTSLCPDCDRMEFFVAVNAMYSDYCETAKKVNMDKPEFYGHLAKDFLKDKDAKPHKLRRYMETIPK